MIAKKISPMCAFFSVTPPLFPHNNSTTKPHPAPFVKNRTMTSENDCFSKKNTYIAPGFWT